MATEQLPASTYAIGPGTRSVTGYEIIRQTGGKVDDGEDKAGPSGAHKARIVYSRRKTLQIELEALTAAAPAASFFVGGGLSDADLAAAGSDWKIRDVKFGLTKGVKTVSLDLISLVDDLA
jgi:hypothetical protein